MTTTLYERKPCGCMETVDVEGRATFKVPCPHHSDPTLDEPLSIAFTLPYPPSGNLYKHHYCTKKVNKNGAHIVSAYYTPQTKAYLDKARIAAGDAMFLMDRVEQPLTGPIVLTMVAYRPRKVGDLDNLLKITQDVLEGIVIVNDKQIVTIMATRKEDKYFPRVEVIVSEAVL